MINWLPSTIPDIKFRPIAECTSDRILFEYHSVLDEVMKSTRLTFYGILGRLLKNDVVSVCFVGVYRFLYCSLMVAMSALSQKFNVCTTLVNWQIYLELQALHRTIQLSFRDEHHSSSAIARCYLCETCITDLYSVEFEWIKVPPSNAITVNHCWCQPDTTYLTFSPNDPWRSPIDCIADHDTGVCVCIHVKQGKTWVLRSGPDAN